MFPTHSLSVGLIVVLILSLFVAFGLLLSPTHGYWDAGGHCGYGGCCGCQQTWYAWSETWHAYNALDMPLRPYYIPRTPGRCDRESLANCGGCACGAVAADGTICGAGCGYGYPPQAGVGMEPVQFERIGKIPNDSDLGGLPAPAQHGQ
jgi:hypothetical protein